MVSLLFGEQVLQERCGLPVFRIVALNPSRQRNSHNAGEEGVFAITFVGSAPARVTRQIRGGSHQNRGVPFVLVILLYVSGLISLDGSRAPDERGGPGFTHAVGLRKGGSGYGLSAASASVSTPPDGSPRTFHR